MKGGVDNFRRKHGNEGTKTVEMQRSDDMPWKLCKIHAERDVRVFQGSLQGVEVVLSSSDPMEETDQFVRNRVFTEEGDLFDCVEDDGGFEDGGIKQVNSM